MKEEQDKLVQLIKFNMPLQRFHKRQAIKQRMNQFFKSNLIDKNKASRENQKVNERLKSFVRNKLKLKKTNSSAKMLLDLLKQDIGSNKTVVMPLEKKKTARRMSI